MRFAWLVSLVLLLLSAAAGADSPNGFRDETFQYNGKKYRVLEADLTQVRVEMYWKDSRGLPYSSLPRLKDRILSEGHQFLAATNAGMYTKSLEPLGLYVERGKQKVPLNLGRGGGGNFFMKPNGVFLIGRNGAKVVESTKYRKLNERILEATQSGPMLVEGGLIHPKFSQDSMNRKIRSGIGVKDPSHIVVALSEEPVNFDDFARLFRDRLACKDALYLDGTISRIQGKSDPAQETPFPFVAMIGIFK